VTAERGHPNPNPHIPLESMTGAQMPEPLAWLTAQVIDSLVIDGHRFTGVDHRSEEHDGRVHVICSAEDGTSILLDYDPSDGTEPVNYALFPAERSA
jgi:hypothetical protein